MEPRRSAVRMSGAASGSRSHSRLALAQLGRNGREAGGGEEVGFLGGVGGQAVVLEKLLAVGVGAGPRPERGAEQVGLGLDDGERESAGQMAFEENAAIAGVGEAVRRVQRRVGRGDGVGVQGRREGGIGRGGHDYGFGDGVARTPDLARDPDARRARLLAHRLGKRTPPLPRRARDESARETA